MADLLPPIDEGLPDDDVGQDPEDLRHRFPLVRVAAPICLVGALLVASYVPLRHSPTTPNAVAILTPPSGEHWFGTDVTGSDVFARTIAAAHTDIPLAVGGTLLALITGAPLGLVASAGGRLGGVIMRTIDIFQAFPVLILVVCLVTLTHGGRPIILVAIAAANIAQFARLSRAEALALRRSRYVLFSAAIGTPARRVMRRHLLPNITGILLAQMAIGSALAVGVVAAMTYLGAGIRPPTPSWGSMIQSASNGIGSGQWWPVVFPAIALAVVIWSLNSIADQLDRFYSRQA